MPFQMRAVLSEPLEFSKREGHRVAEAVEDVDFLLAGEDELDGMSILLKLEEGLATHAAGGRGLLDKVAAGERSDGHSFHWYAGEIGACRIECGTFSTDASEGRILLISTDKNLSVVELQGGADLKITIGRIGVCGGLSSEVN